MSTPVRALEFVIEVPNIDSISSGLKRQLPSIKNLKKNLEGIESALKDVENTFKTMIQVQKTGFTQMINETRRLGQHIKNIGMEARGSSKEIQALEKNITAMTKKTIDAIPKRGGRGRQTKAYEQQEAYKRLLEASGIKTQVGGGVPGKDLMGRTLEFHPKGKIIELQRQLKLNEYFRRQAHNIEAEGQWRAVPPPRSGQEIVFGSASGPQGRTFGLPFGQPPPVPQVMPTPLRTPEPGMFSGVLGSLAGGMKKLPGIGKGLAKITALPLLAPIKGITKAFGILGKKGKKAEKDLGKESDSLGKKLQKARASVLLFSGGFFALAMNSPLLQAEMAYLGVELEQLGFIIGDSLAPIVDFLANSVANLLTWYQSLSPEVKQAIEFGLMITGVLLGAALAAGILSIALSPVTLAIIAIGAAMAVLFLAWTENWFGIQDAFGPIIDFIVDALGSLFGIFDKLAKGDWAGAILDAIKLLIDSMVQLFLGIPGAIYDAIAGIFYWLADMFKDVPIIGDILNFLGDLFSGIGDFLGNLADGIMMIIDGIFSLSIDKVQKGLDIILHGKKSPNAGVKDLLAAGYSYDSEDPSKRLHSGGHAGGGILGGYGASERYYLGKPGEMVLSGQQQRNLFSMVSGGGVDNSSNDNNITINIENADPYGSAETLGLSISDQISNSIRSRGVIR